MRSCWPRRGGMGLRDLAGLAGEIYARSLPADPDGQDRRSRTGPSGWRPRSTARESLRGPEPGVHCGGEPVLDSLSAPAGAEDTRSQAQRYHDALHEAMRWLGFCFMMEPWAAHR